MKENMTAEKMRECIEKTTQEAWERLVTIDSYCGIAFISPHLVRWFALDVLCRQLHEHMTAEKMRECIEKTTQEAWERLKKYESDYGTDSDCGVSYMDRWLALHELCCQLDIDY